MRFAPTPFVLILAAACAASTSPRPQAIPTPKATSDQRDATAAATDDRKTTLDFLQPNAKRADGTPIYLHVTEADMPLVVSLGSPRTPPRDGSTGMAREVAIEAMQMWEDAIRPHLPWFELQFTESDPTAAIQVEWKRRIPGPRRGVGYLRYRRLEAGYQVGGAMELAIRPGQFEPMTLDELKLLVAHEFGHVLGLKHCLECDSAMNYAWHTRDRLVVTELDVRTFLRLVSQPNGSRAR